MASETAIRSLKQDVLGAFQYLDEQGFAPFGNCREVLWFLRGQGLGLDKLDVGVCVGRMVIEGELKYALDGIRLAGTDKSTDKPETKGSVCRLHWTSRRWSLRWWDKETLGGSTVSSFDYQEAQRETLDRSH